MVGGPEEPEPGLLRGTAQMWLKLSGTEIAAGRSHD